MTTAIAPARAEDLRAVLALLGETGLPEADVADHFKDFLVAREADGIVGAVGLERYGEHALLRSLVVVPARRRGGLGVALAGRVLEEARTPGVRTVYLLTETAADWFPRLGFRRVARDEVAPAVRQSVEFTTACCETAVAMRRDLG